MQHFSTIEKAVSDLFLFLSSFISTIEPNIFLLFNSRNKRSFDVYVNKHLQVCFVE